MQINLGIVVVTDKTLKKIPHFMDVLESKVNVVDTLRHQIKRETWVKCEYSAFKGIREGDLIPFYRARYENGDIEFYARAEPQ